jgi:hypothetical protein
MDDHLSSRVLLVRPASFAFNPETASTNNFSAPRSAPGASQRARAEVDALAIRLADAGVEVLILEDSPAPCKPDAVFPNNWVSFHADGSIVLYPMAAASRREERRIEALLELTTSAGLLVHRQIDLTYHEHRSHFLEGTGSLVLDRSKRKGFACLSSRTHPTVIADFDARLDYETSTFNAIDHDTRPVYHTNVMMSLGRHYAIVCMVLLAETERRRLAAELHESGRELIEIDYHQFRSYAANSLELRGRHGEIVAMSDNARASLRADQVQAIERLSGQILAVPVPWIERVGGGSVRCMIAEVPLPRAVPLGQHARAYDNAMSGSEPSLAMKRRSARLESPPKPDLVWCSKLGRCC